MADAQENTPEPQSQGGDDEGDEKKLYAKKYKSVEELEKGYEELEKGYHGTRQEISEIKELVLSRLPEHRAPLDNGDAGYYRDESTPVVDENTRVLGEFYNNPKQFINNLKQEVRAELQNDTDKKSKNEGIVAKWAKENPDIAEHHDLLQYQVAQTDPRLTPEQRLEKAGIKVRERLLKLRGQEEDFGPGPGDHIEGPYGGNPPSRQKVKTAAKQGDPESELRKFVAQRNASKGRTIPTHQGK